MHKSNVAVLGDGGWGTTLARHLYLKGHRVVLWSAFADYARALDRERVNKKFLPGIKIPRGIRITHDLAEAVGEAQAVVIAIPSQYVRASLMRLRGVAYHRKAIFISVTKGIEVSSLKRISEIIQETVPVAHIAVLTGPTIAHEVAGGIPTSAVAAATRPEVRRFVQDLFMTERFRIYTNKDVIGAELGGSLKNVIAIACGVSDGLGFGTNTKAAILSRGLAEMARLGLALGAQHKTFSGLSGLGDLVTTCFSPHSRNRFVGEQIGQGKPVSRVISQMQMIAEGVPTARSAHALGVRYGVDLPIVNEVYRILYKGKSAKRAVNDLMTRQRKEE